MFSIVGSIPFTESIFKLPSLAISKIAEKVTTTYSFVLMSNRENQTEKSKSKFPLIGCIASIYTTFLLEEPIHKVGTLFPGSLKVEEKDGKFYCPVRDANIDTPNAVCNICLAEQLDF